MKSIFPLAATLFAAAATVFAQESDADLARQLSNPVASLISIPFQFNYDAGIGPANDGHRFTLNFQPVVPLSLNDDWNLIVRTIVPIVSQEDVFKNALPGSESRQQGLGDIVQSFFFSPKRPGPSGIVTGFGPVLLYPSATDELLGSEKWGAGPTGLLLKQTGGWTYGILANHLWSFAGEDSRRSVNATFIQPFLSYQTATKTTFGVNVESTYDWNESQWTVPINVTISQLVRLGKLPVSFAVGGRYYAEGPGNAPEWGLRFVITPLFPTGGKPSAPSLVLSEK